MNRNIFFETPRGERFFAFSKLYFLFGFISSQKISVGGEIYLGEIFFILIMFLKFPRIPYPKGIKGIGWLLLVWAFFQFVSDIYNETSMVVSIKGVLAPVFLLLVLLGLYCQFSEKKMILFPVFIVGATWGFVAQKYLLGDDYFVQNPWKWGLGYAFIITAFYVLEFRRGAIPLLFVLLCFVLSILNSARSIAIFILVVYVCFIMSPAIVSNTIFKWMGGGSGRMISFVLILLSVLSIAEQGLTLLFTYEPFLDMLPYEDAVKYKTQAGSELGILLGGRSELLVSTKAFLDSPWFGHGSWAIDPYYVYLQLDLVDAAGGLLTDVDTAEMNRSEFYIPTHSYLMAALVWGGGVCGLFWINIIWRGVRSFLSPAVIASPFVLFLMLQLVWNILFSPFGADARWFAAMYIFILLNMERAK